MLRPEVDEVEVCKDCGQHVLMMCQKWTGFCSALCEERYELVVNRIKAALLEVRVDSAGS